MEYKITKGLISLSSIYKANLPPKIFGGICAFLMNTIAESDSNTIWSMTWPAVSFNYYMRKPEWDEEWTNHLLKANILQKVALLSPVHFGSVLEGTHDNGEKKTFILIKFYGPDGGYFANMLTDDGVTWGKPISTGGSISTLSADIVLELMHHYTREVEVVGRIGNARYGK